MDTQVSMVAVGCHAGGRRGWAGAVGLGLADPGAEWLFRCAWVQRSVCGRFRRRWRPADLAPPWPPGWLDLRSGGDGGGGELRHLRVWAGGGRWPWLARR